MPKKRSREAGAEVTSTPEHERHGDFAAGRHFVFDDSLGMDEDGRYHVEVALDFLPERVTVFASGAYTGGECLTAEKLVTAGGRRFVFIRAATREEEDEFFGGDDG